MSIPVDPLRLAVGLRVRGSRLRASSYERLQVRSRNLITMRSPRLLGAGLRSLSLRVGLKASCSVC